MVKNQKGGKGHKKSRNSTGKPRRLEDKTKDSENQYYGKIIKAVGDRRFQVEFTMNGEIHKEVFKLAGAIRKCVHITSYVLLQQGVYSEKGENGRIVEVYDEAEVQRLRHKGLWDHDEKLDKEDGDSSSSSDENVAEDVLENVPENVPENIDIDAI